MRRPPTLYVHTPFCRAKCRYCAFFSTPVGAKGVAPAVLDRHVAALEAEARVLAQNWREAIGPAASLFFGGGTPSLLGPAGLARVMAVVRAHFLLADDAEITLEANPESATPELLHTARALGFNRLSLGAQSLDDRDLAALGRVHDAQAVEDAVWSARAAGFDNLGLDLIFGLPGQTPTAWLASLRKAVALTPEHLSCYGLGVEPGTPLAADAAALAALPNDDAQAEMFLSGAELLESAGYEHYEISNFARPGRRCRHNASCWRGEDVLGLGPAAVSTMSLPPNGARGLRWTNPPDLNAWEALALAGRAGSAGREELSSRVRAREAVMLALRTTEGLDVAAHRARFGENLPDERAELLDQLGRAGLAKLAAGRLRLTRDGMLVSNGIIRALEFEE